MEATMIVEPAAARGPRMEHLWHPASHEYACFRSPLFCLLFSKPITLFLAVTRITCYYHMNKPSICSSTCGHENVNGPQRARPTNGKGGVDTLQKLLYWEA